MLCRGMMTDRVGRLKVGGREERMQSIRSKQGRGCRVDDGGGEAIEKAAGGICRNKRLMANKVEAYEETVGYRQSADTDIQQAA